MIGSTEAKWTVLLYMMGAQSLGNYAFTASRNTYPSNRLPIVKTLPIDRSVLDQYSPWMHQSSLAWSNRMV